MKVEVSSPNEVTDFFLTYLVLPAALWPWNWINLYEK
jgi:hypothetical protein